MTTTSRPHTLRTEASTQHFERASRRIPGGVNSPVRAFKSVGGTPLFIDRALGSRLFDVDGNSFIDYVGSWGPLILGHAHPAVIGAIREASLRGTTYGAPTASETELAELIAAAIPSIEMIRFVSSGTEATMSAIRLARAFTGRDRIVKFDGCYHGHADSLLVRAGSAVATLGLPDSAGVPLSAVRDTLVVPYNDLHGVTELFDEGGHGIAAVIVEPVAGNMGVVSPAPGFLEGLRRLTREHGALLIFDEVITGFRVAFGGAQSLYGVRPDLTCLGKIIGGGLPVGAYGGRGDVMSMIAPLGPVYQAGTLSGNPIAMAAGLATLHTLRETMPYEMLDRRCARLVSELQSLDLTVNRVGSMFTPFFGTSQVTDYAGARQADTTAYAVFFHRMLESGVNLAPSQFEAGFLSTAHSDSDIEFTIDAAKAAREAEAE